MADRQSNLFLKLMESSDVSDCKPGQKHLIIRLTSQL